ELGIPCSEVFSVAQGVDFADQIGLTPVQPAGEERIPTIKHPVDYSRSPVAYDKAPPKLDQDRKSILDWLNSES
ncbi:MAG: CoA transferase, partial [Yaniella sp.]|nr:CoA transferase [Yaniella sp.]